MGKCSEALARIGRGLAANPSVTEPEMLLYVHATVAPFLLPQVGAGGEEGRYFVRAQGVEKQIRMSTHTEKTRATRFGLYSFVDVSHRPEGMF